MSKATPLSCTQVESTVLPAKIDRLWSLIKGYRLEELMPNKVSATKFSAGGPNEVGSVVVVTWADGASWEVRINEISDVEQQIGYQVITTEPAHQVTSIQGRIQLRPVSDDGTTFLEWTTEFSNDADASVILDQKYKKMDFFADMKQTLRSAK